MGTMRAVLAALVLATAYVASLVLFPVERVEVLGLKRLEREEVLARTGLLPGEPWLWVLPNRLVPLQKDPWVAEAMLEKPQIGVVRLRIREREPFLPLANGAALATDGTLLPGGAPLARGPRVEGQGPLPVPTLLALARAYPEASRIRYSPAGFWVDFPEGGLFAADARLLLEYAQAERPKGRIFLYSWGVSVGP